MKKNKKGFALLEAIIAMSMAILIVGLLSYINIQLRDNLNNVNKVVAVTLAERFKQDLYYLKDLVLAKGKINFHETADPVPGWDKVPITKDGETLNELNGIYKLLENETSCGIGHICLEKIGNIGDANAWSDSVLISSLIRYDVDSNGKLIIYENESTNTDIANDCSEASNICVKYRMIIEDAEAADYTPIKYTKPSGLEEVLHNRKKVTFQLLDNELGNIKEFNYTLTSNY